MFGLALREAETSILRIWKIFHLRLDRFCFFSLGCQEFQDCTSLHLFTLVSAERELLILFSLNWHTTNVIKIDMMFKRSFVTFCTYHDPKCNLEQNKTSQRGHSDQWDITPTSPTQTTKEHCQTFYEQHTASVSQTTMCTLGMELLVFFLFQEKKVK